MKIIEFSFINEFVHSKKKTYSYIMINFDFSLDRQNLILPLIVILYIQKANTEIFHGSMEVSFLARNKDFFFQNNKIAQYVIRLDAIKNRQYSYISHNCLKIL